MSNHRNLPRMLLRIGCHIGLFVIGYILATLLSAAIMIFTWRGNLLEDLALFAKIVGAFALLPALGVIAIVKWRRLNALIYLPISAGIVGFAGALLVSADYSNFTGRGHAAFIVISTLSGAASGLVLWFFTLRRNSTEPRAGLSEKPVATDVTNSV